MRGCPKCSSKFGDDLNFCLNCDAMLEKIAETPTLASANASSLRKKDEPPETAFGNQHSWTCSKCNTIVPAPFTVCRNCGTGKDRIIDSVIIKDNSVNKEHALPPKNEAKQAALSNQSRHTCARCGSTKVIPKTQIRDQGQGSDGQLCAFVDAKPEAMIFKERIYSKLLADICAECGHVELRAQNPRDLYTHYLQSKSK